MADEMTTAEAETAVVQALEIAYDQAVTDGENSVTNLDNLEAATGWPGEDADRWGRAAQRVRTGAARVFEDSRAVVDLAMDLWGKSASINNPHAFNGGRNGEWWRWMRMYLDDVGVFTGGSVDKKVAARGFTRGGEPAYTGYNVYRLNVDEFGQGIDTGNRQTMYLEGITGPGDGEKQIRFTADDPGKDIFTLRGRPNERSLIITSTDENFTGDSVTTSPLLGLDGTITDEANPASTTIAGAWTINSTANWSFDTDVVWRTLNGSLKTTTDLDSIYQDVTQELDPRIPHLPVAWVYTDGINAADGFSLTWGGKTQAFTGLTDKTWTPLVPDRDLDLFPTQFDQASNGGRLTLAIDNDFSAGTFYVGPIFWIPMQRFNATWWAIITDETNPIVGATTSVTDTLAVAGTINHAIALLYGDLSDEAYLTTTGTNTISAF